MQHHLFRAWLPESDELIYINNYDGDEYYFSFSKDGIKVEYFNRDHVEEGGGEILDKPQWEDVKAEITQFTGRFSKGNFPLYVGDIVKIHRTVDFIGDIKQLDGGQYYIDHKAVILKYSHQIHCEICETESPTFFLDFCEAYEVEIIGNIFQNPELCS